MCKLDKMLLYSYADDSIEPLEKIIVEEHLKYCSECMNELKEIKSFENSMNAIEFDDIELPKGLDNLCELVLDNCISEKEKESSNVQYANYKEGMNLIKSTVKDGYKMRYNNPCDRLIQENINSGADIIKKAAKKYCRDKFESSKFSKSTLYRILKAV